MTNARGPGARCRTITSNRAVAALFLLSAGAALVAPAGAAPARDAGAAGLCREYRDLAIVNAKIVTGDAANPAAAAIRIVDNRIVRVADDPGPAGPCTKVLDFGGKTVIPGLIDSHAHLAIVSTWPGLPMLAVENPRTLAGMLAVIHHESQLAPKGAWLSAMGSWLTTQFPEKRFPNLAELDAASPDNPVLLYENVGGIAESFGPAVTNSEGMRRLRKLGIAVADDGRLVSADGQNTFNAAFNALQKRMTYEDRAANYHAIMRYMLRYGLTGWHDKHGGTNGNEQFRRYSFLDRLHGYDDLVEMWRRGEMSVRARLFFSNADRHGLENPAQFRAYFGEYDLEGQDIERLAVRLDDMQRDLGDDWLRYTGQGEHIAHYPWSGPILPVYEKAARLIASRGWTHEEHSLDPIQTTQHLDAWEAINKDIPLAPLHWSLAHVPLISERDAQRLGRLGGGATSASMSYTNSIRGRTEPAPSGPMLRRLLDNGVVVGAGTDFFLGHLNPWHNIYFMTTGITIDGKPVNTSQAITRPEALKAYTLGSAWHARDETRLGSIEAGKLADLVVLDTDFRTATDQQLLLTRSSLTMVDGRIVYSDGATIKCGATQSAGSSWFRAPNGPECGEGVQ